MLDKQGFSLSLNGCKGVLGIFGLGCCLALLSVQYNRSYQIQLLEKKLYRMTNALENSRYKAADRSQRPFPLSEDNTKMDDKVLPDDREEQSRKRRAVDDVMEEGTTSSYDYVGTRESPARSRSPTGGGGATFIRWGRTECPPGVETVYEGFAGGSHYTHTGAASETLCMPRDPVWGKYSDGAQGMAFVYGVEYEDTANLLTTNAEQLVNHNVPCAVCRSRSRQTAVMIPARNICYNDWKIEYHGYLMSGHHGHVAATEYICMDEAPEADPAGYRDENGKLLYRVEAVCGSLPCPAYVANRDLSCVVCSK